MHRGSFVKQWRTHANIQQSGGPTAMAFAGPIRKAGASLHADVAGSITRTSTQTTVGASSIVQKPVGWTLAVTSFGSRNPPPSLEPCLACWQRAVLKPMCAQSSSTCKAGDADLAHKTTYKTAARGRAQARTPQGWRQAPCSGTRPVHKWVSRGFRNGSRAARGARHGP